MRLDFIALMVFSVFISSVSQILLKKSATKSTVKTLSFIKQYLNLYVTVAYLLLFIAMGITMYAFTIIPLKYGAVIETLGYAFVMLLSAVFLHEKLTIKKVLGNCIIIVGIVLFNMGF